MCHEKAEIGGESGSRLAPEAFAAKMLAGFGITMVLKHTEGVASRVGGPGGGRGRAASVRIAIEKRCCVLPG